MANDNKLVNLADLKAAFDDVKESMPSKTSQLTNDSGYITEYTETDPTVPSWAKASSKPSYSASEVGAKSTQSAVNSPTASGTALAFIDTISQNAQGVITPTKKTVAGASQSAAGLMSADDKKKLDGIASGATANTGTVTSIATGVGLTGGTITGSGTVKAKLKTETSLSNDSTAATETSGRVYPVAVDKSGYLAVNVPWTDSKPVTSVAGKTGVVTLAKGDVGLGNVDNKSSATIRGEITSSNVTTALGYTPLNASLKGANSGIAELDTNGKVPSSQLPSYVDDVLEYANSSSFPTTGESGKIYIAQNTNKTYRWSGTAYVEISASLALGTTSSTAYRGDYGNAAYTHAVTNKGSAFSSGLYKITTNSEGHVTDATAVVKSDITGLGIPGSDTTYTFDGTYNASTNKAATVSTVTNAIAALDGNLNNTTPGAGKTLTAFSETDGKVSATFGNISITKSQVSDLGTIGAAAAKGVDTSIAASSTSTNLPTSQAVAAFVEGKGYKTTDNNTTYSLTQDSSDGHKITLTPSSGTAQTITIPDNNTWRGIQDNLTSSSNTTESLSAKQGYLLANGSARDDTKLPYSGFAHYSNTNGNNNGKYYKISINSTSAWMLNFTIKLYHAYRAYDLQISGYQNGSQYWFSPCAIIIGASTTDTIKVLFGYDSISHLWVAIPAHQYAGISIISMTNGFRQVEQTDLKNLFTIEMVEGEPATKQTEITAYRPWYRDEIIPISNGGTGADTAADARTNLGLGNVENKSSATIRGELTKANVTTALGYTPPTTDTNTWRPIGKTSNDAAAGNTVIADSTARTISAGTSSAYSVTNLTADHVVAAWRFSGGYTDNNPPADITVTTANGSYTIQASNLLATGITMQPIFIKP